MPVFGRPRRDTTGIVLLYEEADAPLVQIQMQTGCRDPDLLVS